MASLQLPNFNVRTHGFSFPNSFPVGSPVIDMATPFGRIRIGDAAYGLCGGMVFAAMDYYLHGADELPATAEQPLFRYFCKRLLDSWNLPFGVLKYYDWQRRSGSTKSWAGVSRLEGLTRLTIMKEWPRIQGELNAWRPVALGLVKAHGYSLKKLNQNHQVLCYGYDFNEITQEVSLSIYDPNYPGDDSARLSFHLLNPDAEQLIQHSCEGPTVRGLFLTNYSRPVDAPPIPLNSTTDI